MFVVEQSSIGSVHSRTKETCFFSLRHDYNPASDLEPDWRLPTAMSWFASVVMIVAAAAFYIGSVQLIQHLKRLKNAETDLGFAVRAIRNSVAMTATIGFTLATFTWPAASEMGRPR